MAKWKLRWPWERVAEPTSPTLVHVKGAEDDSRIVFVWTDLSIDTLESIEGVENAFKGLNRAQATVFVDPRYDKQKVVAAIHSLAELHAMMADVECV